MASLNKLNQGILIALEGIDGAGKTTQLEALARAYRECGLEVVTSKEPTSGKWGQLLRDSAKNGRLSAAEEVEAFIEDRRDHVLTKLRPALDRGCVVLVDRYYLSTAAYQGVRGFNPDGLLRRNEEFAPIPDLAVLLEVPASVGVDRILGRGDDLNHFEKEHHLTEIAQVFSHLNREYIVRIDGTLPILEVTRRILQIVAEGPLFRRLCLRLPIPRCEPEYCRHRIENACLFPGLACLGLGESEAAESASRVVHDARLTNEEKLAQVGALLAQHPATKRCPAAPPHEGE